MVKRKVSTNGDTIPQKNKKVKKVSESLVESGIKIDMTSPEKVITSILNPTIVEQFFSSNWEKENLFIKREDKEFYGNLFSLDTFKEILKENELNFETDVNVCRYVNDEKELLNEEGRITVKQMQSLLKDKKATFQIHQPQRFSDALWNIMEKLETYFGCLFGSNVYITPAGSQGLAPHCDDVEIFVLQLEGKKTWKLYKPMVELSRCYTQDLQQADIGEAILEVTLEPGDMLYFPRGTIHQAKTTDDGHSTHISLSTYQQNSWGDFLQHAVSQAIENALEDDVTLRAGLPVNYLKFLGTGFNMSKYVETGQEGDESKTNQLPSNETESKVLQFKETIKQHLGKLIDHIDVNTAADAMSVDFMASRLPPYGHTITEDQEADNRIPKLEDEIKIKYPEHVRVVYSDDDDENSLDHSQLSDDESDMDDESEEEEEKTKVKKNDEKPSKDSAAKKGKRKSTTSDVDTEDEDDDDDVTGLEEEPCIRIMHSLNNLRESHMSGDNAVNMVEGTLKLPLHFASAAVALLNSKDFVAVKDLLLDEDDDKLTLATTLFADDIIEIKS